MSRSAFDRRFKEATTYAPLQFVKAMRLSHAALRLRQDATVSEAAYGVGYASASQFSREFRRQFGASPRDWGRAHGGDGARSLSVPFASVSA
ncbi:helix-turn-helix transcriptional regulator [Rubrivirga sp. S365]|uniref:helix-turn-helix transcriptional regulator n=1 Tax=Rubrivirga sp. S365 TaxID=3076080 RepID=UPI0028C8A309|nr:helix-turn-helix transcriptional regulator [Rubrivirga sp. S365]MDT7858365.1 helix-turn-helix transcriptional regulator [Rubrivirga sp. S365]